MIHSLQFLPSTCVNFQLSSGKSLTATTNLLIPTHADGPHAAPSKTYQLPHLTTCGEMDGREKGSSPEVMPQTCRHFRQLRGNFACTWFETTQDVKHVQPPRKPSHHLAMATMGCYSPSAEAVSEGHRLGERQEDVDPVRGRQGLAKSQQDVWDVSIRFAACRSGVQKGQTLPLPVSRVDELRAPSG